MITKEFVAEVQKLMGKQYDVVDTSVMKNNGMTLEGVSIKKTGENVASNIYVSAGMMPEDVVRTYEEHESEKDEIAGIVGGKNMLNREYVLKNVIPSLINRERNEERLKELVHEPYADLEMVFRVKINETSSYLFKNEHLGHCGLSKEEVYSAAMENIQGKCRIWSMAEMFKAMGAPFNIDDDFPMLIITNESRVNGASAILDKKLIEDLHERVGENFVVIPSSVHEMLILPKEQAEDLKMIADMIVEVNRTEVEKDEFLSDNAYIYTDTLRVA